VVASAVLLLGASSPEDRKATDPKSIASPANATARPVPIDDLYFTRSVGSAAWSPDGQWLAFCSFPDVYIVASDGSQQTNLTNLTGSTSACFPAWAP